MIPALSMTQSVYETIEAVVLSCPRCSGSFLFEHYPSVHRVNGPNCAGHLTCEEGLSEQKELFAGFCVCFF